MFYSLRRHRLTLALTGTSILGKHCGFVDEYGSDSSRELRIIFGLAKGKPHHSHFLGGRNKHLLVDIRLFVCTWYLENCPGCIMYFDIAVLHGRNMLLLQII